MNIHDVREWFRMADNDYDTVILLNEAIRRHYEIICYHCAQAAEKYLKGFLIHHNVIPRKTHDLVILNDCCSEFDNDFQNIQSECDFLVKFATDIRYPSDIELTEIHVNIAIAATEKIRNFKPLSDLRLLVATDC